MSQNPQQFPPIFQTEATAEPTAGPDVPIGEQVVLLLQQLVDGQQRQNELLERLIDQLGAAQRQKAAELGQWRQANPQLARGCRRAAETLGQVQMEFLQNLIDEVMESAENLRESEFMINEFVDRYGPRLAHLNSVLQVLAQLSSVPNASNLRR